MSYTLNDFDFDLPKECIAHRPANPREHAKLLEVANLTDRIIADLPSLVRPGDVMVLNNTKVIPARLKGHRGDAKVEITLHKQLSPGTWKVFAKPAKRLRPGDIFSISEEFHAEVIEKDASGEVTLTFNVTGEMLFEQLQNHGSMPLPPYIERNENADHQDDTDYQTRFAKHPGAVAAPTAGLHFTDHLMDSLRNAGVNFAYVTLHVGAGTFLPVKTERIEDHQMHSEYCILSPQTVNDLREAKAKGGRIIAVGTTSLRVLESASLTGELQPFEGETDIFITPGYSFNIVDVLMTNFHLPKSTLFMLVSAFCGLEKMRTAYEHAIAHDYRFFSYGDACWLERSK